MGAGGCFPCSKAAGGVKLTTHPHLGAEVKNGGVIIKVIKPLHAVILARNSTVSKAKREYF
jgi:hypothetical protein